MFTLIAALRQVSIAPQRGEALSKICECLRGHVASFAAMKKKFLKVAGVHGGRVLKSPQQDRHRSGGAQTIHPDKRDKRVGRLAEGRIRF